MRLFGKKTSSPANKLKMLGKRLTRRQPVYLGDNTLLAETAFGRKIYLDASDVSLTPHIVWQGEWEPWVTEFFQRELNPGDVFVDIGANCGFFALLAAHIVGPKGGVVALEPQTKLAKLIRNSFFVNGFDRFAQCLPVAIGAETGTAELQKSDFLSGSASIAGLGPYRDSVESVPVKPLADALEEASTALQRPLVPNVIKIDSEGYEWLIWQGAKDLFAQLDRLVICLEFTPGRYANMGQSPRGFLDKMERAGFTLTKLDQQSVEHPLPPAELDQISTVGHGYTDLVLRKGV